MCGIAGIVHPHAGLDAAPEIPLDEIRAMTDAIAHRGPDGEGFHRRPGLALGHRRLAIVDLEGGAQPMSDPTGRVWLTFNGEIYNHLEIRRELEARGRRFRTRSDSEVLIHGYLEWGEGLLNRLNGMFAFAIWDSARKALFLARDIMGQKPLFYTRLPDGTLLFASEIKAFAAHPGFRPEVDEAGLAAYLTFEYLPAELSIARGVRKLPPAHFAWSEGGELAVRRYWDLPIGDAPAPDDATEQFVELFDRAVERHLMSDVPLGIFLSGGLDSSAVAAAAARVRPPETIQTFAIGFDDPSFDESAEARRVATHLGTTHRERIFTLEAMRDVLPRVAAGLDEPFGDASLLPMYLLSQFTRETVTVALGGDGGDELLMGYPTFKADVAARLFRRLPGPLRRLAHSVAARLPVRTHNFSFDFVVRSFLSAAEADDAVRHPLWLGSVTPGGIDDPLLPEIRREFPLERVLAPAIAAYRAPETRSSLQRLSSQYCRTYLAEDILHKVDRASMAHSLEARPPLLDRDLVEFVARLPREQKLRADGTSKVILRRATSDRLPRETLRRRKKGFGIPLAGWLKGPLEQLMGDLLSPNRIGPAGFFRTDVVDRLVRQHRRGERDHRKVLWTLISFEMWRDRYRVGGRSPIGLVAPARARPEQEIAAATG